MLPIFTYHFYIIAGRHIKVVLDEVILDTIGNVDLAIRIFRIQMKFLQLRLFFYSHIPIFSINFPSDIATTDNGGKFYTNNMHMILWLRGS